MKSAPTLDHVIPLAKGGEHSRANVRCAHFICNSRRGANLETHKRFDPRGVSRTARGLKSRKEVPRSNDYRD